MKTLNDINKVIAVISQSSHRGGAETAMFNLISSIVTLQKYDVLVIFPDENGPLFTEASNLGLKVASCCLTRMLGNPAQAAYRLSEGINSRLKQILQDNSVDLVISNTVNTFDAALVAADINIPHIWSIHEMVEKSPEYKFACASRDAFSFWINSLSDHIIFCSNATKIHYNNNHFQAPSTILAPFQSKNTTSTYSTKRDDKTVNLYFFGNNTARKNPHFAVDVLRSIRLKGIDAKLHFIGLIHNRNDSLDYLIRRRKMASYVVFMGYLKDPYKIISGVAVNLVCSICEPYGLTIIESLSRGIPVVAPNIDGPAEILSPDCLYEANDIASCVRVLEKYILNYENAVTTASTIFHNIGDLFLQSKQAYILENVLDSAFSDYRKKSIPKEFTRELFYSAITGQHATTRSILLSIVSSTGRQYSEIVDAIKAEQSNPGSTITANIAQYDVVPFAYSAQMEDLYKYGDGFYIELLANFDDPARKSMAAYIILTLITEERRRDGVRLRVLAVGDGIGLDSMRLAYAGFDVDYIDVDRSVTSSVAATNFDKFNTSHNPPLTGNIRVVDRNIANSTAYDAIVSLEVIEHVSDPIGFLRYLSDRLADNGLLFISDCFGGVDEQFPTHLSSNERFHFLLPYIASHCGFMLKGFSRNPNYKPYVFVKISGYSESKMLDTSLTEDFLELFVLHKESVHVRTTKGIDSVVSIGRHLIHLGRSFFYRNWLRYM